MVLVCYRNTVYLVYEAKYFILHKLNMYMYVCNVFNVAFMHVFERFINSDF